MRSRGNIVVSCEGIFEELDRDDGFKESLGLFENVKRNNNFYHDKQWEGVRAPDLDKPVFNIIKPAINYYVSMLVSDDIGVNVMLMNGVEKDSGGALEEVVRTEIEHVLEKVKFGWLSRKFLRACAIDGDSCLYMWWDENADGDGWMNGAIKAELVNNTDICFGDKSTSVMEEQPFVIIKQRRLTRELREEAKADDVSDWEGIVPDGAMSGRIYNDEYLEDEFTTVATKFWKVDGEVWWMRCTRNVVLEEPQCLGIRKYPLVYMSWEEDKNCCHGVSPVTGKINNQIFVNKIYAMSMEYVKNMAFPKLLYDATLVPKWNNKIGQAIAVNGNPQQAVFASFTPSGMNAQAIGLADSTIKLTKDSMGVYDAALGNVRPDNSSAIIALQQASAQPLELQKLDFYQAVEDFVRVLVEFMGKFYGLRQVFVSTKTGKEGVWFDFAVLNGLNVSLKVDIGASNYWSELMQIRTLDSMLVNGLIPNALTYLEQIPDRYVRNKAKIMDALQQAKEDKESGMNASDVVARLGLT